MAKATSVARKNARTQARAKPIGSTTDTEHSVRRGRQVIRHLRILSALDAAPQGLTVHQVLHAVGRDCALRTIYRDLEQLEQAGFALMPEDQRWRLSEKAPRWRLPIETSEVLSILLAEQVLRPLLGTGLGAPLVQLRTKLLSAISPKARAYCEELSRGAAATVHGPGELKGHEGVVVTLQEALVMEQAVRLEYGAPRKPVELREVEPYATWYAGGRLYLVYLVARCRRAQELRTFAVARIRKAEILEDTFDVDPDFKLDEYVRLGFGVYHGATHRVVIELSQDVAHVVKERTFHPSQRVEPLEGGGVRVTMDAAGLPEIAAWVSGFGGLARAIAPPELVSRVREIHVGGALAHGANPGAAPTA